MERFTNEFFTLQTKTILLKSLQMEDAGALLAYRSHPDVWRFQLWCPKRPSDARAFIRSAQFDGEPVQGRWNQFGIYWQETGELIGDIGLNLISAQQAEIGYTVAPQWQRQGIGRTAVSRLLTYLFNTRHLHRVIALTDSQNSASMGMLKKLGFRQEGHFIESYKVNDTWHDELQFALLNREWASRNPDIA